MTNGRRLTLTNFEKKSSVCASSFLKRQAWNTKMTIKVHEKLLLTGAAGCLGKALRERLKANCSALRLSDIQAVGKAADAEEIILADLADAAAVDAMVRGVDAIVHLGGISVEGPFGPILQANILGFTTCTRPRASTASSAWCLPVPTTSPAFTGKTRPSPPTIRPGPTACTA